MRPFDPALLRAVPAARRPVAALGALGTAGGLLAVGQALLVAWLVTAVATGGPLRVPALALLGVVLARGLLAALAERVTASAGQRVSAAVRRQLLRRWLTVPEELRPAPEVALTRATEGAGSLEPYVGRYLPALVTAAVVPVLAVVTLAVVDVWSALVVVLTLPLMPLFAALIGKHTQDETEKRWAALTTLSGHFLDVVRGLPTLVNYGRAEHQAGIVAEVGERHRRATVRTLRTAFLSTAALELLATISVAMVAVGVGLRLAVGWVDLQVALTAILLAPEAYWPVRRVGAEFHNAADGAAALEAMGDDLGGFAASGAGDPRDDAPAGDGGRAVAAGCAVVGWRHVVPGAPVSVEGVRFAHPGRAAVLDGLSLHTPVGPGLTALTGASGAGKSTLLDVLAGLHLPGTGSVTVPGDVHYARQRPLLVPGTVRDNLLLAAPNVTDGETVFALTAVGLWPALAAREGLDTVLGDDGFGLSAGQRARLSLARARLASAPVLLLDEPTAHVAARDKPRLHEVILELAEHRRVVVATHDTALAGMAHDHWSLLPSAEGDHEAARPDVRTGMETARSDVRTGVEAARSDVRTGMETARSDVRSGRRVLWAGLLGGLSTGCGVALTAASGWLIVQASFQPVILTLLVAIVGVRAFGIGRPLLRYAERVVSHDIALADLAWRRSRAYDRLIPLTPARLGRRSRADVLTAVVQDLDDVADRTVRVTVPLLAAAFASGLAVLVLLFVLPTAAPVLALGTLAAFAVGRLGQRLEAAAHRALVTARGRVHAEATAVAGQLSAYRAVVADPGTALTPLDSATTAQAAAVRRAASARAVATGLAWLVLGATATTVAWQAGTAFAAGTLSAPFAALVALTPLALADTWTGLPEVFGARARAAAAATRLEDVLAQEPAVVDPRPAASADSSATAPAARPRHTAVSAELSGVTARWAEEGPIDLAALDLCAAPGSRVLLTGPNGAGKSTALAVLARHLDALSGSYRQDGTEVNALPLAHTRSTLAVVDDEPHVFAGTVRANLLLARPDATDEEVCRALAAAGLRGWLDAHRGGLDATLTGLSGGERTRLAIARAILSDRPVLLLDEPTAHLDRPTARSVLHDLVTSAPDRAVVMVSHEPVLVLSPDTTWDVLQLERPDAPGPVAEHRALVG
ncbi:thiol reductant ABC exporter subunit CydD [Ornithinicoccus hortensis]|uniref:ATP-binding cassette subfamily C protein CydCD n=1 Tax=Ornithinicoccus hortensis TaxID=82346 RepID=A0A542YND4_9MICO|nr:thiol reductant ABC exporter subunit CydD [Ornithinicoccus hortensis]TQL49571.1 ATP-binding cassette subfamily C protein CydCD [Ornithinicoccus hortensis]